MALKDVNKQIPSIEVSGRVKILERVGYKDGIIVSRMFDEEIFVWDVIWNGQIYSGHFIVTLPKGKKKQENSIVMEVGQMCYAGAATTIDMLRGEGELSKEEKQNVALFESARKKVAGKKSNGKKTN